MQHTKEKFEGLSLLNCLESIEDPRLDRKKLYPLREILLVSLCAMLSGVEGFRNFELYGNYKLEYLKKFYPFSNGIPSHDTFARLFSLLDPKSFETVLNHWVDSLKETLHSLNHIAIDGKSCRGSKSRNKSATHLVCAFSSETRLVLGQKKHPIKVQEKMMLCLRFSKA